MTEQSNSTRCTTKRPRYGRYRILSGRSHLFVAVLLLVLATLSTVTHADQNDEFMRELLEEERRLEEERMRESGHQYDDSYVNQQQEDREYQEQVRQEEADASQERVLEQERERIREQRETEFEAKLARMNDDQQKAAVKQKKRDAKVVRRILNSFEKGNYYSVLGLLNFEWTIGPVQLFSYKLGPFTLFRPSAKDVKKAYRSRAMLTHPDKNRDGRAQEAFVAVEESASILGDETMREEYDMLRKRMRIEQRAKVMAVVHKVILTVRQQMAKVVWVFRNLLGPFATPIFILGCLIV